MRNRLAALLLLLALPARAAFEDLGAGARAPGMGDAFVPVADDLYSIYYNPAGLGLLARPQFGTSYSKLLTGLTDGSDLNTSFIGYVQPLRDGKRGTLGVAWNSFTLNNSLYRDQSYYLSYGRLAYSGAGELYAGASFKMLNRSFGTFADIDNATLSGGLAKTGQADPALKNRSKRAFDADLGLLYRVGPHYQVGLAVAHALSPNVSFNGVNDKLPPTVKLGLNYRSLLSNLVGQVDARKSQNGGTDGVFTVAAERWFPRLFIGDFAARAGMSLGTRDSKVLSLGTSFRTRRVQVDYGFQLPINTVEGTAGSHKMAIGFRFGRASEEDESLEMVLEAMRQLRYGSLPTRGEAQGLSKGQKVILDEYLGQIRQLQAAAKYKEALDKMTVALTVAPADKELVTRFGRLNFVGQQIKQLPDFKSDPMQALLHQGLIAYIAGNDVEAVAKVSEALSVKPDNRELAVFLEQLEGVTGMKRTQFPATEAPKDYGLAVLLTQAAAAIEDKRYEAAIDLSLKVLKQDEENSAAWANLGTAYFALRDYERSLDAWKKALAHEKNPSVRVAIKGYLRSIERAKDRRPSKKSAAEPVEVQRADLTGEEIEKLYNEGIDLYIKRELEKAKAVFEKILEANPAHVEARKALRRVKDELPPE